jgi:diguanylate cyclase (GGDEF)-like protein
MYLAEHDDLTGLLNRKSFQERLRLSIEQHRSTERQLAVLFVDLDRFKGANEALGHAAGDKILLETARRLRGMLGEQDALARFGGDEFVMLAGRCGGRTQVAQTIERTLAVLRRPMEVEGQTYSIRATIGAAIFPALGATHEDLIRNASLAMERAKSESPGAYRFYDRELESELGERASLERELDGARGTRSLWIAYQPQWDVKTGKIQSAESLLRWDPAAARGIPMGRIVSIAEESGLILPIGQWVVKKALAQLQDWQSRVSPGLGLAINLSAVQLHQQDVSALFKQALRGWKVAPAALKVEITESVLLRNSSHVTKALTALHEAGVGLVLDDFGTGYSSLNHLRQFPIESVKIDVSFVKGIGHCRQDEAIVNGIVQLGHSLGLTVVAEGVETTGQLDYLRSIGCDSAQGFLVSPAVRPNEFEQLLAANDAAGLAIL